jgi:hypothetical protein
MTSAFRAAHVEIARNNGKSAMLASTALQALFGRARSAKRGVNAKLLTGPNYRHLAVTLWDSATGQHSRSNIPKH